MFRVFALSRGRVANAVGGSLMLWYVFVFLQERRLLFDVYIGTLFVRSGSGYDAVREWVEPLVDCGIGKGRWEDGAESVIVKS